MSTYKTIEEKIIELADKSAQASHNVSEVERLMREDVANGLYTSEEFEEKTGIPYIVEDAIEK